MGSDGTIRLSGFESLGFESSGSSLATWKSYFYDRRWQAPELFEDDNLEVPEARPNFSTDVYAFGITCVEVSD